MADVAKILEDIKALSLIEVNDLVKALEEEFGVSAAAPVMVAGAAGAGADPRGGRSPLFGTRQPDRLRVLGYFGL